LHGVTIKQIPFGTCPKKKRQFIIIFFLVSQVLHNATSSIAPENDEARKSTTAEGNHIYNILTIGLARYAQFPLLVEVLHCIISRILYIC
jgi:hypothetical protein